jgi:hypothetical protein
MNVSVKGNDVHSTLKEYCDFNKDSFLKESFNCQGFIVDSYILNEDEDIRCFKYFLYSDSKDLNSIEICESIEFIDWDNPYGDYEKLIPVNITVDLNTITFWSSERKFLKMGSMSDEDFYNNIWNQIREETSYQLDEIYIKQREEMLLAGYYTTGYVGSGVYNLLVLNSVNPDVIDIKNDVITLGLETVINGIKYFFTIDTKEFLYEFVDQSYEPKAKTITIHNIEEFVFKGEFSVVLKFDNESLEIEEYMQGIENSEERNISLNNQFDLFSIMLKDI